jgi:hypothetical protein
MQEINAWLTSCQEFKSGAALYQKYGKNSFLKKLLLDGPTPYTSERLVAELTAMAPAAPATIDAPPTKIRLPKAPDKRPEPSIDQGAAPISNPADLERYLQLKEYQKTLYRQMERNMTELDLSSKESFLHMTAKNIMAIHSKIRDIYKLTDYFDAKGTFPDGKVPVIKIAADEIQALRVSTSRAKTRLRSPGCRNVEQTKQLIEDNNKRIIELGGTVKP